MPGRTGCQPAAWVGRAGAVALGVAGAALARGAAGVIVGRALGAGVAAARVGAGDGSALHAASASATATHAQRIRHTRFRRSDIGDQVRHVRARRPRQVGGRDQDLQAALARADADARVRHRRRVEEHRKFPARAER